MSIRIKDIVIVLGVSATGMLPIFAMPTDREIEKVAPMIESLMKDDVLRMRQGRISARSVGESAVELAKKADTPAAKYYLLTRAMPYFAKDGMYARIEETVELLKKAIPDIPVKELVGLIEPILARASRTDPSANRLQKS